MDRVTTGVSDLDTILGGGLPLNSLNVIAGSPGTGKTILAQQLIYANARPDAPALYLTTLSEPAPKMLRYLQRFPFYDEDKLFGDDACIAYRDIAELIRSKSFAALPELLTDLLRDHRPAFLVIDSFKALRELGSAGPELRRVLFDLGGELAARSCTTVLVGEYTAKEVLELPEFAIADGIVHLVNRQYGTRDERYLRVFKLRGSSYHAGEHAFRVTSQGLSVFPRLVTPARPPAHASYAERISTGVAGLDAMIGGGLRRGSATLVAGSAGTGKTLLGLQFLFAGIAAGEHGLLINFQENPSLLHHLIAERGLDVHELDEGGRLTSLYMSPVEMNIDDVVQRSLAALAARPVRRVVIDSLGDLEAAATDPLRFRGYVYALMQMFAVAGVTSYATMESLIDPSYSSFTQVGASHISDNVIALRHFAEGPDPNCALGRTLAVIKCRGSDHDHHIRRMTITARGVEVEGALPR